MENKNQDEVSKFVHDCYNNSETHHTNFIDSEGIEYKVGFSNENENSGGVNRIQDEVSKFVHDCYNKGETHHTNFIDSKGIEYKVGISQKK